MNMEVTLYQPQDHKFGFRSYDQSNASYYNSLFFPSHSTDQFSSWECASSNGGNSRIPSPIPQNNLPLLPPCRICGEKASGFHYGANTCEACKGFFRRSLHKTIKYKCVGKGNCEIVAGKRGLCGACRYKKCLAVGMSKQAIKTGRYTHEKKTKDIEEVRKIIELKSKLVEQPAEDLENIVRKITAAHIHHLKQVVEKLSEKEKEYLEAKALQEKVFGSLKPISAEEYMKIYEITGIDVDGRRDLVEGFIPLMENCIKRFIAFAKAVPGFSNLQMDDQIGIIKASRFEVWMILHHRQFNHERRLYTTIYGKVVCMQEMLKVHEPDYIEFLLSAQRRIKSLGLDYEETCILGAFTMMFTDRCTLQNPSKVEEIQDLLLRCLIFWFKKSGRDVSFIFAKIIDILTQLRMVRFLHTKEEEKIAVQYLDKIQMSPLVFEMWSS